jgi:phage/plasmid-like protein (TIGR03299 family)
MTTTTDLTTAAITTPTSLAGLQIERMPWSQNIVSIPAGATAAQMLEAAGLNWEVEFGDHKREQIVYRQRRMVNEAPYLDEREQLVEVTDPATIEYLQKNEPENIQRKIEWVKCTDVKDVRRTDNWKILGQVGSSYKPVQNEEALRFCDNLLDEGGRWIAGGSQYDDKMIYGVMQLTGDTITIAGDDAYDLYLVVRTSHNGTTGVQVLFTPIRFECTNMMPLISRTAKSKISIRHVADPLGQLQNARTTLQLGRTYFQDAFAREVEELLEVPVTEERAKFALERVIPANRSNRENVIHGIMEAFYNEEYNRHQNTGLGLVNGVTDYFDHIAKRSTPASRLQEQFDGEGRQMLDKMTRELLHR